MCNYIEHLLYFEMLPKVESVAARFIYQHGIVNKL